MKKDKIYTQNFPYEEIMNEAKNYKYAVVLRDHYKGNAGGDLFSGKKFQNAPDFCLYNIERPVYKIVLTDKDVVKMMDENNKLISEIYSLRRKKELIPLPARPMGIDGRKTERTAPKEYAEWREMIKKNKAEIEKINKKVSGLEKKINRPGFPLDLYKWDI